MMTHNLPMKTHCINSAQTERLRRQCWKVGERASVDAGSPINHLLTNCRTGRFARNIESTGRAVPCSCSDRLFLRERRLPLCGLRKKDPAGSAKAEAQKPRKTGGITVFIRALVGGVNGSPAHFHFRCCRKGISSSLFST